MGQDSNLAPSLQGRFITTLFYCPVNVQLRHPDQERGVSHSQHLSWTLRASEGTVNFQLGERGSSLQGSCLGKRARWAMLLVSDVAESVSVTYPVPDTGPVTKERHSKLFLNAYGRMSWKVHSVCPALTSSLSAASSPSQKTHTPCRGEPRDCSLLQCLRTSISSSGLNVSQPRSVNRHFNPSPSSFPSASYSIHCTHPPSGWVWFSGSESNLPFSFPLLFLGLHDLRKKKIHIWTNGCLYECVIPISPNSWTLKLFHLFPMNHCRHLSFFWRGVVWCKGQEREYCLLGGCRWYVLMFCNDE